MGFGRELAAGGLAAMALVSAAPVAAEAQTGVIRGIQVEGNQRIEAGTVQSYLLVQPGDSFDPARLDLSLKTLFNTGLFADVAFERAGDVLVIKVVENPVINQVLVEGNRALKTDKIKEEIQASPRGVFTKARVQADVQRIVELYRRSGRFAATVTPKVKELDQNRVDLIFEIEDGPVTDVRRINFIGNEEYSDRKLRSEIVTEQSRWWKFLTSNDNYDPDRLEYDQELLRQFYYNQGYADFRVVSAEAALSPDQEDFFVTFTIEEGEQYTFGDISVSTQLEKLNGDALEMIVPIRTGTIYRAQQIEDAIDTLTFAAGTAGYAFVDIRPSVNRNRAERTIDIEFEMNEGPRVYIDRIDVVGNTRTVDRVIRREMRLVEGDAFNQVLLDRSKNRIRALGFFESVEIEQVPSDRPDRTSVQVAVKEQPTGELSFGAGFSSTEAFLFDLSISERNFRGLGQFLRFRTAFSSRTTDIDVRFTEPRFLGRDLAAGIDIFGREFDYEREAGFSTTSIGGGLRVGFPVAERTQLGLRYRITDENISLGPQRIFDPNFVDDPADPNDAPEIIDSCSLPPGDPFRGTLCDEDGSLLTSLAGYTINWDRTNDPIRPSRGFQMSLSQDVAGLGGDAKYLRSEFVGSVHRGVWRDLIANLTLSSGYIFDYGGHELRINDRFFKGGASFRGFDVAGIGPRPIRIDIDGETGEETIAVGNALGGQAYGIATFDLNFPLGLPEEYGVRGALFAEAGTLGLINDALEVNQASSRGRTQTQLVQQFEDDGVTPVVDDQGNNVFDQVTTPVLDANGNQIIDSTVFQTKDTIDLRVSIGASLFWKSPFGPIRFDFAEAIIAEEYDRQESFRFSTSTQF